MNTLILLTVIDIVLLIAGLAIYLFIVGAQLTKVAGKLEEAADLVWKVKQNAEPIESGVERINRTGGVVAVELRNRHSLRKQRTDSDQTGTGQSRSVSRRNRRTVLQRNPTVVNPQSMMLIHKMLLRWIAFHGWALESRLNFPRFGL